MLNKDNKIIKCMGYCYEGHSWNRCNFWVYNEKTETAKCSMFDIRMIHSLSLVICNEIYGYTYEGGAVEEDRLYHLM